MTVNDVDDDDDDDGECHLLSFYCPLHFHICLQTSVPD